MVTLVDGPCVGTYMVKRAPTFLRAVQIINFFGEGETDLLDQIEDTPDDDEKVFVYKREGDAFRAHIHGPKVTGWYQVANYRFLPEVDGETLRDNKQWQDWCIKQGGDQHV